MTNSRLAYFCLRFALGISFATHGAVRLPKLGEFAENVSGMFAETFLAGLPSLATAHAIPPLETAAGIMILAGWKTIRWGLTLGAALMGILMFGSCLLEEWDWVQAQLIHLALFYLLLMNPHTPGAPGARQDDAV